MSIFPLDPARRGGCLWAGRDAVLAKNGARFTGDETCTSFAAIQVGLCT